ncbi:hypothetical protein U0035_08185 [Niabella yanshanensis]|uniref:Uncharacterized protein n=1 Tax=Niabella yanshanensis TaxID=577386 RepID=A0ABZ0WC16_9BACT|nr:hypothetical protein [Niabella yanshanensis]WQD40122.1 hypothetical protein U0035_08185 [Niabella yanshanensis]
MQDDDLFSDFERAEQYKRRFKARGVLIIVCSLVSFVLGMLVMLLILVFT